MKEELSCFERHMRNRLKKEKNKIHEEILESMLKDLKEKHEREKKEKIQQLQQQLEKVSG